MRDERDHDRRSDARDRREYRGSTDRDSDRTGAGFRRRYTSRYAGDEGGARASASDPRGQDAGHRMPERAYGSRRRRPPFHRQGSARTGSQRGEHSVQGVSGRAGGQYGDRHGPRPSDAAAEGYQAEEQFGGKTGRTTRGRRYGSRRGHGSEKREDPRTEPEG